MVMKSDGMPTKQAETGNLDYRLSMRPHQAFVKKVMKSDEIPTKQVETINLDYRLLMRPHQPFVKDGDEK